MKNLLMTISKVVGYWIGRVIIICVLEWLYFNTYLLDDIYYLPVGKFMLYQHVEIITYYLAEFLTLYAILRMIIREVNGYYIKEC